MVIFLPILVILVLLSAICIGAILLFALPISVLLYYLLFRNTAAAHVDSGTSTGANNKVDEESFSCRLFALLSNTRISSFAVAPSDPIKLGSRASATSPKIEEDIPLDAPFWGSSTGISINDEVAERSSDMVKSDSEMWAYDELPKIEEYIDPHAVWR